MSYKLKDKEIAFQNGSTWAIEAPEVSLIQKGDILELNISCKIPISENDIKTKGFKLPDVDNKIICTEGSQIKKEIIAAKNIKFSFNTDGNDVYLKLSTLTTAFKHTVGKFQVSAE